MSKLEAFKARVQKKKWETFERRFPSLKRPKNKKEVAERLKQSRILNGN